MSTANLTAIPRSDHDDELQSVELHGVELLQQRLSDPRIAEGLSRLLDRIDTVSFAVEAVEGFVARGDTIADSVAETVHELKNVDSRWSTIAKQTPEMVETGAKLAMASRAIDVDELERSNILKRLSDPNTLSLLNSLLDRLPLFAFAADSMEGFLRRGDTIVDNVTGMVHELKLGGQKIDLQKIKSVLEQLPKLEAIGDRMLNSGLFDKDVLETLAHIGKMAAQSYQAASSSPTQPVGGLFGIMRASKDPDVQKSVGFLFAFAKAFSKHVK